MSSCTSRFRDSCWHCDTSTSPGFSRETHPGDLRASVAEGRRRIEALADAYGIPWVPSSTNFVALDFGSGSSASAVMARLLDVGVFLGKPTAPPLDRSVRAGIGTGRESETLATAFGPALEAATAASRRSG